MTSRVGRWATALLASLVVGCGDDGPDRPATAVPTVDAEPDRERPSAKLPATPCTYSAIDRAVRRNIDDLNASPSRIHCSADYAIATIDLGGFNTCLPESTEEELEECANVKTTYWENGREGWSILTYGDPASTDCAYVRSHVEANFPRELCGPRAGRPSASP